jgi:hypothetical protein
MGKTRNICEELRNTYKSLVRTTERKKNSLKFRYMCGTNMEFFRKYLNVRMRTGLNSITVQSSGRFF